MKMRSKGSEHLLFELFKHYYFLLKFVQNISNNPNFIFGLKTLNRLSRFLDKFDDK